jgi:DNA modification methylase
MKDLLNKIHHGDCLEFMKQLPDKCIDLVLTDPPYGIDFGTFNRTNKDAKGNRYKADKYKNGNWDKEFCLNEYFIQIKRISHNWIIWGGNYFDCLFPNKGFIFWHKKTQFLIFLMVSWLAQVLINPLNILNMLIMEILRAKVRRQKNITLPKSLYNYSSGVLIMLN